MLTDSNGDFVSIALSDLGVVSFSSDPIFNNIDNGAFATIDSTIVITRTGDNVNLEVGKITGFNVVDGTINGTLDIQDGSITGSKLQDDSVNNFIIDASVAGNGLFQNPTGALEVDIFQLSGTGELNSQGTIDITGNNTTALFNSVSIDVADNAITQERIADNAVGTDEIINDAVTTIKILDQSITNAKLDKANIPLSGFEAAAADIDIGNNRLINIADPIDQQDAATRNYVDTQLATADDDITAVTFDGTNLTVDEGNTTFFANLSDLEESEEIAVNTAALAAHIAVDTDTDETNELSDIQISGTTLTLTNPVAGAVGVDLDATFVTDAELTAIDDDITAVTFDGTNLTVDEGNTTFFANLSDLEESEEIAVNTAALAAHIAVDTDTDETNELSDISITGTTISLTNPAAGAVGVDLDATFATNAQLTAVTSVGGGNNLATDNLVQDAEDRFYDLNGNDLQFSGSGSVGIGNFGGAGAPASIESKLDVDGVIRARDRFRTSSGSATLPGYGFFTSNDNNMGMFRAGVDLLGFSTNGIEALRIDDNQNVGIGVTNPLANLHVNGDIRADGGFFSSDQTIDIPDYVFQKYFNHYSEINNSYKFKNLEEIEIFIREKNHLPGIKSAQEIKNQGYWDLTEASKKNLEKIEELFLHTIEQEKKINLLKSENKVLAKELNTLKKDLAEIKELLKKQ